MFPAGHAGNWEIAANAYMVRSSDRLTRVALPASSLINGGLAESVCFDVSVREVCLGSS